MRTLLKLDDELYDGLMAHLLPPGCEQEQAAFLFARQARADHQVLFEVVEATKLGPADFAAQQGDYLEMTDEKRAWLIKRAHDLGASLVEMHSHLGPWPAAFSLADRAGLRETVSHMWWRLRNRPYLAVVVTGSGFDALLWLDNPKTPRALDGLLTGNRLLRPTNNSLEDW